MPYRNPQDRVERDKRHYAENGEVVRLRERTRYHANKVVIRSRRKELWGNVREANNERERRRYADLRQRVLAHYGAQCSCCGERQPYFSEVDHKHDNGAAHRREIGRGAKALLAWIVRNDFPDDCQILCANCNQGKKRNGGICPHQQ